MTCANCRTSRRQQPKLITPSLTLHRMWVGDVVSLCRTGDVVLFSSKRSASNITKYFTGSDWDHVGMVIKPTPTDAFLFEWGAGLYASELHERLTEYAELDARFIAIRQLKLSSAHRAYVERQMETIVDRLFRSRAGLNVGVPVGQVIKAARKQYFGRIVSRKEVKVDDVQFLFCSKTVAVVYKAAGIVAPNRNAADFLPKHFDEGYEHWLDLQKGASLGPLTHLTFESPNLRAALDGVLNVCRSPFAGLDMVVQASLEIVGLPNANDEERAARLVQKFVLVLIARRELTRRKRQMAEQALASKTDAEHAFADFLSMRDATPAGSALAHAAGETELALISTPNAAGAKFTPPAHGTAAERTALLRQLAAEERPLDMTASEFL